MATKTDYFYKVLHIISWIIFIGVCIEAGAFLFNTFFTLFINPVGAGKFWMEIDLSGVYTHGKQFFVTLTSLMIITAVLKAIMFYIIVKLFHDKKVDLAEPFNEEIGRGLLNIAYIAIGIGLFSYWGMGVVNGLTGKGVKVQQLQQLRLGGADVWLFMGVIMLVFAKMFRKGIEIQHENQLTV